MEDSDRKSVHFPLVSHPWKDGLRCACDSLLSSYPFQIHLHLHDMTANSCGEKPNFSFPTFLVTLGTICSLRASLPSSVVICSSQSEMKLGRGVGRRFRLNKCPCPFLWETAMTQDNTPKWILQLNSASLGYCGHAGLLCLVLIGEMMKHRALLPGHQKADAGPSLCLCGIWLRASHRRSLVRICGMDIFRITQIWKLRCSGVALFNLNSQFSRKIVSGCLKQYFAREWLLKWVHKQTVRAKSQETVQNNSIL